MSFRSLNQSLDYNEMISGKNKTDESLPNFLYTSAHCLDLETLRKHYESLQSHEWCDLDERHPIAIRNKHIFPEASEADDEGWLDVERCIDKTDECLDE